MRPRMSATPKVLAVLDEVSMWTAAPRLEIGYAFARGKPILLGYRGDQRLAADNEAVTVSTCKVE